MAVVQRQRRRNVVIRVVWGRFVQVQGWVLSLWLVVVVVVTLANILMRYLLSSSISWADEFGRLSLLWLTFLGAALAVAYGAHIVIDALGQWLGEHSVANRVRRGVVHLLALAFFALLLRGGWELASANFGQLSPALRVPLGYAYLAIPVGAGLMALNYVASMVTGALVLPQHEEEQKAMESVLGEERQLP